MNRLKAVFKRLHESDVRIKPEKCLFLTKEISNLGFKITDKSLFKSDEKIRAIKESQAPTNVSSDTKFSRFSNFLEVCTKSSYNGSAYIPADA